MTTTPEDVLIVHGGWSGHEPEQTAHHAAALLRARGLTVTVANDLAVFADVERLRRLRLIVPVWTMGTIDNALVKNVSAAVREGVGLAGWHGGMCDAFRQDVEWQFMTGGQWVAHPGNILTYGVDIHDRCHLITEGVADFSITTEQYYLHVDPAVNVLATTVFSGEHGGMDWIRGVRMPVAWTKPWGKGRVFYTALGHTVPALQQPDSQRLLDRGMAWAARLL